MAINGFLLCWYILTCLSITYLIYDQLVNTPSMWVMGLAWGLVILYTGPIGLFFYLISCRQPMAGTHEQFINEHWKQALGSEIHCIAGDATAIIITAGVLHYFLIPNGTESIIEYIAAYLFGLFIFQALFMQTMFGNYWIAVRQTIFSETVSMNLVMAGMIPVIVIIKSFFPIASNPTMPYFWGMMTLATLTSFIVAYPINSWLVRKGIKHGMMSRGMTHGGQHSHSKMSADIVHIHSEEMHMETHSKYFENMHSENMNQAKSRKLSLFQAWFYVGWTYVLLIGVISLCSLIVPIRFFSS